MDTAYLGKLLLSILLFAPGLLVLIVCLFFALLMLLEKWGIFDKKN